MNWLAFFLYLISGACAVIHLVLLWAVLPGQSSVHRNRNICACLLGLLLAGLLSSLVYLKGTP
jgi:hypothetical protein